MPLQIIRNDITKVKADAIVNTANPEVAIGAGVDEAIYKAAGEEKLLEERAKIGHMDPGQAAVTPAFGLDADYIIHTVGPAWIDGNHGEREAVASCYRESLRLAKSRECDSVAFPLISTGTYGFPKDQALKIAIDEISSFLFENDMTVYMVVYDKESFVLSGKAFQGVQTYIEEKDVRPRRMSDLSGGGSVLPQMSARRTERRGKARKKAEPIVSKSEDISELRKKIEKLKEEELVGKPVVSYNLIDTDVCADIDEDSYAEMLSMGGNEFDGTLPGAVGDRAETFHQMLFRHIDRKGLTDPQVYKRANIDRRLFSKIRSDIDYTPSKRTVLALAIALELNLDETVDLLLRAGYALSPSIVFDRIVFYCITNDIYNIFDVNACLFKFTDQILA